MRPRKREQGCDTARALRIEEKRCQSDLLRLGLAGETCAKGLTGLRLSVSTGKTVESKSENPSSLGTSPYTSAAILLSGSELVSILLTCGASAGMCAIEKVEDMAVRSQSAGRNQPG